MTEVRLSGRLNVGRPFHGLAPKRTPDPTDESVGYFQLSVRRTKATPEVTSLDLKSTVELNTMVPMSAKLKIVSIATLFFAFGFIAVAESHGQVPPQTVVRNLYAARKSRATDPFFQTKSRARLDKFFAKELGDLIWNDTVTSRRNNEVGKLAGDPLYNAQDMKITAFRIKRPMYGEGNLNLADVPVTFKNFGKDQTILVRLERDKRRVWKITDIFYPDNEDSASSLTKILSTTP